VCSEDLSAELAKMHECPLKQTSFSLSKGTWFTHKWWLASNVRNYAVIQGVMDILEKLGYQLKFADKDFIVMVRALPICLRNGNFPLSTPISLSPPLQWKPLNGGALAAQSDSKN
jgi:hypothetical protein